MKGQFIVLILLSTTRLLSQDTDMVTSGDSLTIRSASIASNYSFDFGESPLDYLMKFSPKIDIRTVDNMHVENKVDTIFYLSIGTDKFIVYKLDNKKSLLVDADILTTRFKTKQGIRIGIRKQEVVKFLTTYKVKTIPNYLILENLEVQELITFKFTNDILTKITFDGYID